MKARISLLHKTEAEWNKLAFIPEPGELVIYDPDDKIPYARLKIGNAEHTALADLPFIMESVAVALIAEYQHNNIADAGRITDYTK
jgi:hypothetical protein